MTFDTGTPCVSEILKDQLYLANLSAALSIEHRTRFSITHILSVCPDYPSTGPNHLTIPVEDSELENLLIHLSEACRFIQNALEQGGRILVHCVMGISRSTTILAAYLMKTRNMTAKNAICFIKQRRPQAQPNYGFIKQLDIFGKCNFDPSPSHPQYRSWRRRHVQDVNNYLNHLVDTIAIIPDKLLMTSEFPDDPEQAQSLLRELGVTHLLSISPAENTWASSTYVVIDHHVNVNSQSPEALLFALPGICDYIHDAVKNNGLVLVHCRIESRACTAVCAYLMSKGNSLEQTFCMIQNLLPLFNPTKIFLQNLELFQASPYMTTNTTMTTITTTSSSSSKHLNAQRQSNSSTSNTPTNLHELKNNSTQKPSVTNGHATDLTVCCDSSINLKPRTYISVR